MRAPLSPAERVFHAEVRAFVDRHWPAAVRRVQVADDREHPADRQWVQALVARGWSVPAWPAAHGGTGWSANEQILWLQEAAAAGTPALDPAGTEVVGPLLCALGTPQQQTAHLPPIREARVRWCVGVDEGTGVLTRPDGRAGIRGARLSGTLSAVPGAANACWLLCRAGATPAAARGTLVMVELAAAGVRVEPLRGLDGRADLATVHLDDVELPAEAVLGQVGQAAANLDRLPALPGAFVPQAPGIRAHVQQVRALAAELAHDDAWRGELAALEVELAGLDGLERRALAAEGRAMAGLRQAAMLRCRALARGLAELATSLLGYYALPFPEAHLIDNEGPIGHDYALTAVTARLRAAAARDDTLDKNRLARWLSGP